MKRNFEKKAFILFAAAILMGAASLSSAQGPVPDVNLVVPSYDFSTVPMTYGPGVVFVQTIQNTGTANLHIVNVYIDGNNPNDFQVIGPSAIGMDIAPGGTFDVSVIFSPRTLGSKGANLFVDSDDPDEPTVSSILAGFGINQNPQAIPDSYSGLEDQVLSVSAPGVLRNDTDGDGNYLGLISVLNTLPTSGTLNLRRDGSFSYLPIRDFNGTDSFTYRVDDGFDISATPAPVTLNIASVIDPPKLKKAGSLEDGPTNNRSISVQVVPGPAPDPPKYVDIAENNLFASAVSVPYTGQTQQNFTLSQGDGDRQIFVRLRNAGGISEARGLNVTLDQTPPREDSKRPLSLVEARSTDPAAVNLVFRVAFTETVATVTGAGTAPGVGPQAIELGGNVEGADGLQVTVTPVPDAGAVPWYEIHIHGSTGGGGELSVGFAPGVLVDQAGNALEASRNELKVALLTTVSDWRIME